jgi:peptidoglycan/LPS O-acetylase OafA/YrhL
MNRIPSLDGWRGIAIALVLFDHIQDSLMGRYLRPWTSTGYIGVTLFFVLSGFLITSKLLEAPISLKRFYLRRFFRLTPAAWTYLTALLILTAITGRPYTTLAEVRACVFFYRNFFGFMGLAGHFWSLSVEEQFYLVWPVTLLLAGVARSRWIALFGAIACALFRWISWSRYAHTFPAGPTFLHADGLMVGCFLAILVSDPKSRPALIRFSKIAAIPALLLLLLCMFFPHEQFLLIEQSCMAILIASTTFHPHSLSARSLSFAPLAWLGTVSYSVYIWQGLFMEFRNPWAIFLVMPIFALASYYFIERPTTRLGHRLTSSSQKPVLAQTLAVSGTGSTDA